MTTMNTAAASLSDAHFTAIRIAQCASCTCLTKTPEVKFHAADCRYRLLEEVLRALSAPTPQADAAPSELASMTRMFHAACADLGAINEALGLDPDDGGAAPILDAIAELKSERDKWVDAGYAASANASQAGAAIAAGGAQEPIGYANGDELDNMLDDRTATIQGKPNGLRRTPLYAAPLPRVAAAVLTDEQIVSIWEGMPDGASGFRKSWGYMQFARALLAASNGEKA